MCHFCFLWTCNKRSNKCNLSIHRNSKSMLTKNNSFPCPLAFCSFNYYFFFNRISIKHLPVFQKHNHLWPSLLYLHTFLPPLSILKRYIKHTFNVQYSFKYVFLVTLFSSSSKMNTHTSPSPSFKMESRRSFVALEQRAEKWDIKWISEAGYLMVLCGLLLSRWKLWTLQECGEGPDGIAQTNPNSKALQSPPNEIQHQSDIISSCYITMEISKRTEAEQ